MRTFYSQKLPLLLLIDLLCV
eukprot:SAG31_NODE_1146_length_9677_cov_8.375131_1_plen_20_part_10